MRHARNKEPKRASLGSVSMRRAFPPGIVSNREIELASNVAFFTVNDTISLHKRATLES